MGSLAEVGYVKFQGLTPEQVSDVRQYFDGFGCLSGYIPGQSDGIPKPKSEHKGIFASYATKVALEAPHLLDVALSDDVLGLVKSYIPDPVIYSVNAYWTFANGRAGTQLFHRDYDDEKFLSLFFFLTDAVCGDGGQLYVRGSHKPDFPLQAHGKAGHSAIVQDYRDHVDMLTGPAGTCVLMNPYGYHAGGCPKVERLICWVRYGTGPNRAYKIDKHKPIACNVKYNPILRLLVDGTTDSERH